MSSEKMGPVGGDTGGAFNDGVFDGVKKITVVTDGTDIDCVSYIKIEYVKDDKIETRVHGTIVGGLAFQLNEFEVDYPSECFIAVGGSYGHVDLYKTVLIKSLIFKTSYGSEEPLRYSVRRIHLVLQMIKNSCSREKMEKSFLDSMDALVRLLMPLEFTLEPLLVVVDPKSWNYA
ncbi:unnamed protein product [Arabidopsis arenosa]|uniref:Jacalin-type lectin domain-containing protein n=1 Tax=Arabidopsis arenosa TaxID=38785 RepID=A0A8S2AMY7_ARAAE|nr:unnamed protein product [Arabidopsis arenosa]